MVPNDFTVFGGGLGLGLGFGFGGLGGLDAMQQGGYGGHGGHGGRGGRGGHAGVQAAAHVPSDERLRSLMTRELTAEDYELLLELQDKNKSAGCGSSGAAARDADIRLLPVFTWGGDSGCGQSGMRAAPSDEDGKGKGKGEGKRKSSCSARSVITLLDDSPGGSNGNVICIDGEDSAVNQGPKNHDYDYDYDHDQDKDKVQDNEKEKEKCIVCMEAFVIGEQIMRLPCQHIFHQVCATSWLRVKGACPIDNNPCF
jgi:hypothetical protein